MLWAGSVVLMQSELYRPSARHPGGRQSLLSELPGHWAGSSLDLSVPSSRLHVTDSGKQGSGLLFTRTFNSQHLPRHPLCHHRGAAEHEDAQLRPQTAAGLAGAGVPCHLVGKTGSLKAQLGGTVSLRRTGPRGRLQWRRWLSYGELLREGDTGFRGINQHPKGNQGHVLLTRRNQPLSVLIKK